jgi:hypothetical protein
MYPLLISLLLGVKKGLKKILKFFANSNKNNQLQPNRYTKKEYDSFYGLSRHLQKDIGLPPYTSRSNHDDNF